MLPGRWTRRVGLLTAASLASALAIPPAPASAASTTTYSPSTLAITNPERGFYHHKGDCDKNDFNAATLTGYRTTEHISLVMCMFYLAEFKDGPISDAQLARLNRQADTVRSAGLKMIVRFAYTESESGDDAPLDRVLGHLDQLKDFFSRNWDVIAVVQSGFVGAWGEGHYTQHFGNVGIVSDTDWAHRKAIVEKLLDIVPDNHMVQMRTVKMKSTPQMYGPTPTSPELAYTGAAAARIGFHNDCFLGSTHDSGTFQNNAIDYPYLAADTAFVAMGGETCRVNRPRSECETALQEMSLFHYSFLNRDHSTDVIDDWAAHNCKDTADKRLGYRFTLVSASTASTVRRGTALPVTLVVRNDGWSAPFNRRPVKLILRHTVNKAVYKFDVDTDPRRWSAGATTTADKPVNIGNVPPGTYDLLLSLPDQPGLAYRPEYAIQLANTGLWEPETGFNKLLRQVVVQD
jgi:hypothetical protein